MNDAALNAIMTNVVQHLGKGSPEGTIELINLLPSNHREAIRNHLNRAAKRIKAEQESKPKPTKREPVYPFTSEQGIPYEIKLEALRVMDGYHMGQTFAKRLERSKCQYLRVNYRYRLVETAPHRWHLINRESAGRYF